MNGKSKWEKLFDEFLDFIDFRLVKYPDGWGVIDLQCANLGDIEQDRFDSAKTLIDRLDIYIWDYIVSDLSEGSGYRKGGSWTEVLEFARKNMTEKDLERYRFWLETLDMICNHPNEIDLENCRFERKENL